MHKPRGEAVIQNKLVWYQIEMMNINSHILRIAAYFQRHPDLSFFLKYTGLFTLLLLSIASLALNRIIATESNPFFYANF